MNICNAITQLLEGNDINEIVSLVLFEQGHGSGHKPSDKHTHNVSFVNDEVHKFSDRSQYDNPADPNLHILVEYLAYALLRAYPHVHIPKNVKLLFEGNKIGLSTTLIHGERPELALLSGKDIAKKQKSSYFPNALLANWDVAGKNMIYADESKKVYTIDPGGALTFRSQGKKKGDLFKDEAGEVKTFRDPKHVAGRIFQHIEQDDLKKGAEEFLAIPWSKLAGIIAHVFNEVKSDLVRNKMEQLVKPWTKEVHVISKKLKSRHASVVNYIKNEMK